MPVVLNLDGQHPKCRVPNDCWRIFVDSEGRENSEGYWDLSYAPGPLDWGQLARLKQLTDLTYQGPDATVLKFLASRASKISTFSWQDSGRARFDFSQAARLETLALHVDCKSLHLQLPASGRLECLRLFNASPTWRATVICPNRGDGVLLAIGEFRSIPGLKQLSELELLRVGDVDLAKVVRAYPQLKSLDISGSPLTLRNEASLKRLKSLERLSICECYSMDVNAFPEPAQLPALTSVTFDGLRAEDAQVLKAKYRSVDDLTIYGKRTAEWIANHLENPFRNWADDFSPAVGKQAMAAWKTASAAIDKTGQKPVKARAVLRNFVTVFNTLDQRTGLETDQREEIYAAFADLAAKLPPGTVTDEHYYAWADYA